MEKKRNFSPLSLTLEEFEDNIRTGLKEFNFLTKIKCKTEDSLPWVNISANRVIKPEEALKIMDALEKSVVDEVLFNSLSGKNLRFVFNAQFQLAGLNIDFEDENDYSPEYAYDFGQSKEEFKEDYSL